MASSKLSYISNFFNFSFKWIFRLIIALALLICIASLLLQLPAIQKKTARWTTEYLSKKTGANVTLDNLDVSIFTGIELQNLNVVGLDTMLSATELNVKLANPLFTLFNNSLDLKSIELKNAKLNLKKSKVSGKIDFFELIAKFSSPPDGKEKEKLKLDVKTINFENVDLNYMDEASKAQTSINFDLANIDIRSMNVVENTFNIDKIKLYKPSIYTKKGNSLPVVDSPKVNPNDDKKSKLCFALGELIIDKGVLEVQSATKFNRSNFDPQNFKVSGFDFNLKDFVLDNDFEISGGDFSTNFNIDNNFLIKKIGASSFKVVNSNLALSNFEVVTDNSYIATDLVIDYNDLNELKNFGENTIIDLKFKESKIKLSELVYFVPSFEKGRFYQFNKNESININGSLYGKTSNLKGKTLQFNLGQKLDFDGSFGLKNVKEFPESFVNLKVKKLKMDVNFLNEIIPDINLPANFYTLGKINFVGNFDGFLKDFVVNGRLNTEIGTADLDLRLDVKDGNEKANYSGKLNLENFNLKKWSGDEALGLISLSAKIKDGQGLIFKTASAELIATINKFQYKNYDYENIKIDGKLSPKEFIGVLNSKDPNIDFDFNGKVGFDDKTPNFNFQSSITNIDLSALNIRKDIKSIKGKINFVGTGSNLNDILGELKTSDLRIEKLDTVFYFKEASLVSKKIDDKGNKQINFQSDRMKVFLEGKYDFNTIANDAVSIIKANFPYHTKDWKVETKPISINQNFKFDIEVDDPHTILDIAGIKDLDISSIKAKGTLNSSKNEINFAASLPYVSIQGNEFNAIKLLTNSQTKSGDLLIHIDSSKISNRKFKAIDLQLLIKGDNIEFLVDAPNVTDSIQNLTVQGLMKPHPKGYTIDILKNDIKLFNQRWKINNSSKISIGNQFIDLDNFQITDGFRSIEIDDINNKGVVLKLVKLDLLSINPLLKYDKIQFTGEVNSNISINDVFLKSPSVTGNILIPSLTLNGEDFGELTLDISKAVDKQFEAILSISNVNTGQAVKVNARYDVDTKMLNADVKSKKLSLKWLEFILSKGIKDLKGNVDLDARVLGHINDLKIDGDAVANGGSVKIIYLGETYTFDRQKFKVTHEVIDLTGAKLKDSQGNEGVITGVMRHKLFSGFFLDISVFGENVIAINTTKYENPIYYGLGKGELTVDFQGSVDAPQMTINAVTKPGTKINIPIKESKSVSDKSFINYVSKEKFYNQNKDTAVINKQIKVEGISIEMNLTVTEDAEVNMIFDEAKNDIINGFGRGNIKLSMSNKGEFDMFGTYQVSRGKYLFTAFEFVNKPFIIREGGTIRWTGDPVNASINISADYPVRTTLTNFISEYLVTDQLRQAAGVASDVNLSLLIGNTLYNPSVKFNFEFPSLTGELKSYTDTKLRLLKNNEVEFNSQVFGLLVFNSFMPSSTISFANNSFIQSAGINTLSEFVGSQFSLYMTSLINSALEDNGLISGIDFDLDLINSTTSSSLGAAGGTNQTSLLPNEIQVKLKNKFRFLDERLSVNVGGNYVRQTPLSSLSNYIIPEFFIEYALTKDRQLSLKLYGKYDLDEVSFSDRRQKFGLGLRYRSEFGSLRETKTQLTRLFYDSIARPQ
jgi:hypothetical protein